MQSDCGLQKGNGVFQQYNLHKRDFSSSDCLKAALIILNSSCTADTAKTVLFPSCMLLLPERMEAMF
jgi:hypothetical protein